MCFLCYFNIAIDKMDMTAAMKVRNVTSNICAKVQGL